MDAGALELVVERTVPVQHTVQDIRGNPPCRKAGYFGSDCESLGGHGVKNVLAVLCDVMLRLMPSQRNQAVACEYAKCKNRESDFAIVMRPAPAAGLTARAAGRKQPV
jgi:hypothetical protein